MLELDPSLRVFLWRCAALERMDTPPFSSPPLSVSSLIPEVRAEEILNPLLRRNLFCEALPGL